jgi:hypothetical protein
MNNVVAFPKAKKGAPPQSMEETLKLVEDSRKAHIENVLDEMVPHFVQCIHDEGFDVTKEHMAMPLAYFVEVIRGVLYSSMRLDHPMSEAAKQFFEEHPEESI